MTLWESGSHVSQHVHCRFIVPKDVECLVGFRHEKLGFFKQAATVDCSKGVSIDQFEDDMPGVSKYQNISNLLSV